MTVELIPEATNPAMANRTKIMNRMVVNSLMIRVTKAGEEFYRSRLQSVLGKILNTKKPVLNPFQ
ncbi:MAG: hypothetical protein LBQ12_04990 [Deltaproteobacteria bacterium]|nr:hypothetical protein [Deltaproteobacteria bacterium]